MKTIKVMTSEENNFNMIFLYENDYLCGMNYKPINRSVSEKDFVNNEELFGIYLNKASVCGFKHDSKNFTVSEIESQLYKIGCDSVMELFDRENIRTAIMDVVDEIMRTIVQDERVGIEPNRIKLSDNEIKAIKDIETSIIDVLGSIYKTRQFNTK